MIDEAPSGDLFCNFCNCDCSAEVVRSFHLKITLADESAKVFAWCTGQTAAELIQISPDDFDELPEVILKQFQPRLMAFPVLIFSQCKIMSPVKI